MKESVLTCAKILLLLLDFQNLFFYFFWGARGERGGEEGKSFSWTLAKRRQKYFPKTKITLLSTFYGNPGKGKIKGLRTETGLEKKMTEWDSSWERKKKLASKNTISCTVKSNKQDNRKWTTSVKLTTARNARKKRQGSSGFACHHTQQGKSVCCKLSSDHGWNAMLILLHSPF